MQGTDITEAFESHHISTGPEELLQKFYVRDAKTKRNSPFTFEENGFYRTLKKNVREALKDIPKQPIGTSAFFTDVSCIATFLFAVLAITYENYLLAIIAGCFLAFTSIASHNYIHKKDNFRMYYMNLSLMDYREWRVTHALSHHLYTNTINDLEITAFEPIVPFLPTEKSSKTKILSCLYVPLLMASVFHLCLIFRVRGYIIDKEIRKNIKLEDFILFLLPLTMYVLGGQSLLRTLIFWNIIIVVGSFHFFVVGFTAAHHHPDIFHDGDATRGDKIDWGIGQLDAVVDRVEITGSHWLVLTNFGDHCLHHMFPTLDHGALDYIYPIFRKTMKEFNVNMRFSTELTLMKGMFRQLVRSEPNPNPPDLFKTLD